MVGELYSKNWKDYKIWDFIVKRWKLDIENTVQ